MNRFNLILFILISLCLLAVSANLPIGGGKSDRTGPLMRACLLEEKPKAKGETAINAVYRDCWRRAERDASKQKDTQ